MEIITVNFLLRYPLNLHLTIILFELSFIYLNRIRQLLTVFSKSYENYSEIFFEQSLSLEQVTEPLQLLPWPPQFVLNTQDTCLTLPCHWPTASPTEPLLCFPDLTFPRKGKGCLIPTSLLLPVLKYFALCHWPSTNSRLFKLKHMALSTFFW